MKRPMLYWGILFVLGVVLSKTQNMKHLLVFCVIYLFVILMYYKKICNRENTLVAILGVVFFLIGSIRMNHTIRIINECLHLEHKAGAFYGKVISKEVKNDKEAAIVKCYSCDVSGVRYKILVEAADDFQVGDIVSFSGTFNRFSNATNYGGFDEEQYRWGMGIWGKIEKPTVKGKTHCIAGISKYMEKLRMWMHNVYYACLGEKDASIACAMVLGEKKSLDSEIKELYQNNGIAHLIAISGLHIAMIGGVIYRLIKRVCGNYLISAGVGSCFICLYGIMTGLADSTVRAIVMLIVLFGADVFGRKYDVLSAVALALLILVYDNPFALFQPGFLLSFGAVLGIAWVKPGIERVVGCKKKWVDGILVSISVEIMTLPVLLWFYYEVPIWSTFLNIIVVPCMSLLLGGLIVCAIIAGVFSLGMAQIVAVPCHYIFSVYEILCKGLENAPIHTFCSGRPKVSFVVVYYILLLVFLIVSKRKWKNIRMQVIWLSSYAIIVTILVVSLLWHANLRICMLDVGQGDGFFVQTPGGLNFLIDGGSSGKGKVGKYTIIPSVSYFGADTLDYVFVTHSDKDHYSGIYEMIQEKQIKIRHLVLPDILNPDEAYEELVHLAGERNITVEFMKCGDYIQMGEVYLKCVSPDRIAVEDKNTGSLVLWLQYKSFDMIFSGDMDEEAENNVLKKYSDIIHDIEVLKIAHHGSASSSSKAFIDAMNPRISFVSVGNRNRYGHPTDIVLKRIENSEIYRTDKMGAVLLTTDGEKIQIQTYKSKLGMEK